MISGSIQGAINANPVQYSAAQKAAAPKNEMGMEAFLKLLTTELSNQDPLEPMKDTDFIAQMASITQLEQQNSFTKTFEKFIDNQESFSAHSFLGKKTTVSDGIGGTVTGTVDSVQKEADNTSSITIKGTTYSLKDVLKIELNENEGDQ